MALQKLKDIAKEKFAPIGVAALMTTMPFAAANADNTPPWIVAEQHDNVTFIDCPDATCVAEYGGEWSENNSRYPAVSVFLGTKKLPHPKKEGEVLGLRDWKEAIEKLFAKNNIHNVEFFAEQSNGPYPAFGIHVNGGTDLVSVNDLSNAINMASLELHSRTP